MVVAAGGRALTRADEVVDERGVDLRECADVSFAHEAVKQAQRRRFGDVFASQGTLVKHVSLDILAEHAGPWLWVRVAHSSASPSPMATSRNVSMATLV